jgi:hypothetical protein
MKMELAEWLAGGRYGLSDKLVGVMGLTYVSSKQELISKL